jgi:GNAT superfamily N-acetyltransferase
MKTQVLEHKDAYDIAKLHLKSFSGFFLTSLGYSFLVIFYKSVINNKNSINLGVFENNKLIGFAIGSIKSESFYKILLKENFFQLLFSLLKPVIVNPYNIIKLLKSFKSSNNKINIKDSAVLLSICVNPNSHLKGIGTVLVKEFEQEIFKYSNTLALTTDSLNNEKVNLFYIRNGYNLHSQFFQSKRLMNFYVKNKIK